MAREGSGPACNMATIVDNYLAVPPDFLLAYGEIITK